MSINKFLKSNNLNHVDVKRVNLQGDLKKLPEILGPFVVYDFETNGYLNSPYFSILESALLLIEGPNKDGYLINGLTKAIGPLDKRAQEVHHITSRELKDKPEWKDFFAPLFGYCLSNGFSMIGYNNKTFDRHVLSAVIDKIGVKNFCLASLCK